MLYRGMIIFYHTRQKVWI